MIPVKRLPVAWYLRLFPVTYKIVSRKPNVSHFRFFEWGPFCAVIAFGSNSGQFGDIRRRWYSIDLFRR